ncbi:MAG: hypothetical protein JWP74_4094 [Marmoricola sp.]|nr:hypothetical protein [Marmoricola sp.]
MSLPRYLSAFFLEKFPTADRVVFELVETGPDGGPGVALARTERGSGGGLTEALFVDTAAGTRAFSVTLREPDRPTAEYDVFDGSGEAIGYFRRDGGTFHLSAPYLDASGSAADEGFDLHDQEHLVMHVERTAADRTRYVVTVPDRRLGLQPAAALVVGIDLVGGR